MFLVTAIFLAKTSSWGLKTQKKKNWGVGETKIFKVFFPTTFFFRGGGDLWVFGAPHAPTRGERSGLERSGLAVKSYHPETAEEEKRKKNPTKP